MKQKSIADVWHVPPHTHTKRVTANRRCRVRKKKTKSLQSTTENRHTNSKLKHFMQIIRKQECCLVHNGKMLYYAVC